MATFLIIFMRINWLNLTKISPIVQRIPCALVQKCLPPKTLGTKRRASPLLQKVGGHVPLSTHGTTFMYIAQLSSGTSNTLNALVSSEQVRFKQTSETVCTDGRVPDKIRERVPDCGAGNWKGPTAVSVEPVTRYGTASSWRLAEPSNIIQIRI